MIFFVRQFRGDVEVHVVAGVVTVDEQRAGAVINRRHRVRDQVERRRREHVAANRRVGQILPDEPRKQRLVTAAAANDQSDLSFRNFRSHHHRPIAEADQSAVRC